MKNIFLSALLGFSVWGNFAMAGSLRVVASIKPVHSIVSSIMYGVGKPSLLVRDNGSPHEYNLRPSDGLILENADIIFWIGPEMENFLTNSLDSLAKSANIIALSKAPGLHAILLHKKNHTNTHDVHSSETGCHNHRHGIYDMHLWLDPINTKYMAQLIAAELIKRDPENREIYEKNEKEFEIRLEKLNMALFDILQSVKETPIVVFHGAYRHFEYRYGMKIIEAMVTGSVLPGAKSFQKIRDKIISSGVTCVFYEPEFDPKIVKSITARTGAVLGALDPEGILIPAGADLYFTLMMNLAVSIKGCISRSR
ncbi:zinc ABC transporter substrate-binding protein [Candidatus Liberibacter sp.]|uniref:zinc ABC transporter substrate-binding protein n=1 Tax=Candidatus Liberibacter sp. TaxID=34022 RepID=UPI0015F5DCB1|nr:zinc ABC transporter substrate-binding protein [Candidatus Liberibacter sp.]MBA5723941.1 zinc ABC transporter substrate-binding protein [Candidatus Liberibacter sp.]